MAEMAESDNERTSGRSGYWWGSEQNININKFCSNNGFLVLS